MKCKKKGCKGFVTLEWSSDNIKDGLFVIEGECEICHAKYAVAMQMFEKSKLKKGARLFEQLMVLEKCSHCMLCLGSSEDPRAFFCDGSTKESKIKDPSKIPPKWCPLVKVK